MRRIGWLLVAAVTLTGASVRAAEGPTIESSAARAGVQRYMPQKWGIVGSRLRNPTREPVELLLLHAFDSRPNVQFGATVWMPPRSKRRLRIPVRPPELGPGAADAGTTPAFGVESLLLRGQAGDGPERQLARKPGLLPAVRNKPVTAMLVDSAEGAPADAAVGLRKAVNEGPQMGFVRGETLPAVTAGYEALDGLIIASDGAALDDAQRLALRQWILGGGRVWIMAERTSPSFARDILGPAWSLKRIDRVSLTDVTIRGAGSEHRVTTEDPIPMVRVAAEGMRVRHRVRGWPASLETAVGRGRVLVTTVGARAWLDSEGKAAGVLRDLGDFYGNAAGPTPVSAKQLEPYVNQWIGYRAMARAPVAAVLALFCAGLVVGGIVLGRLRRLEHMGWIAGVGAVLAAVALWGMGTLNRRQVPLTFATGQIASVQPRQQHAVIGGVMGIYSPTARRGVVRASRGGIVWSDVAHSRSGAPLRTIWTDIDQWHWENFDLPSGAVVQAGFRQSSWLEQPVSCRLSLGAERLSVRFRQGPFRELTDPLLATKRGALTLERAEAEQKGVVRFVSEPERRLPKGQYVDAGVLTNRQRLHQQLYSEALAQESFPRTPTLLAWARPMDLGLTVPEDAVRRDRAMVAVTTTLEPPAPGSRVVVPPLLVPYEPMRRKGGGASTAFDPIKGEFIPNLSRGMRIPLGFTLPAGLGRIDVTGVTVHLKVDAAAWRIRVRSRKGDWVLASADGPTGEVKLKIDEHLGGLQPDAQRRVPLVLEVARTERVSTASTWTLHDVGLAVRGAVPAEGEGNKP